VFRLYGEPGEAIAPGFVHVERISARAPLHDWEIRPHRHPHLSQAFLFTSGHGLQRLDEQEVRFRAPWLIWLPANTVHGFSFQPGTEGLVVTVADDFLTAAVRYDPEAAQLRNAADEAFTGAAGSPDEIDIDLASVCEALLREAPGDHPGAMSASLALLKLLLVGILRTRAVRRIDGSGAEARANLYRRYRKLVEAQLRRGWSIARYARELSVTTDRLHAACTQAAGKAPQQILHDRLLLEAKRSLIFTTMSVAEIAGDLGFGDPAYFSRFFASRAGLSPTAYRKR
jgi:AraC family transcriptional regulator, transcriptional activator of pobA